MASISDHFEEDKRLLARVDDAVQIVTRRYAPHFIGFLDERQTVLVRSHLPKHGVFYRFFGGHDQAERVILGVFPDEDAVQNDTFPLTAVGFSYRATTSLSHRDVLGSLLGSGITRDKIGDILCSDECVVVFLHDHIAAYVAEQITKIGRVGVKTVFPYTGDLPAFHQYKAITGTVACARLDAVLKVLLNSSREQASERIRRALVQVDHQSVISPSYTVHEGQILSVRGSGRFVIDDVSQSTKKGRIILKARQYI